MKHHPFRHEKEHHRRKWGFAIFLILAGLFLLLHNLDILPFRLSPAFFSWKAIPIFIGTIALIKGRFFPAVLFLGTGFFLLAPEIFDRSANEIQKYWPLLLVLFGIAVLTKRKKKCMPKLSEIEVSPGFIQNTVLFGGINKKITAQNFEGAKLTAVFGGLELDLTGCKITVENSKVFLEITAVFGGISLTIPKAWDIQNQIVPIMGGFEDNTINQDNQMKYDSVVVVTGNVVFGGVEIKRA